MAAKSERYEVAPLADLEESAECIVVENKKYLVCEINGKVYAYRNVCPHQNGPVVEGRLNEEQGTIICPWHGWEFDLEGGQNLFEPGVGERLPQVKTEIEDGIVYIIK